MYIIVFFFPNLPALVLHQARMKLLRICRIALFFRTIFRTIFPHYFSALFFRTIFLGLIRQPYYTRCISTPQFTTNLSPFGRMRQDLCETHIFLGLQHTATQLALGPYTPALLHWMYLYSTIHHKFESFRENATRTEDDRLSCVCNDKFKSGLKWYCARGRDTNKDLQYKFQRD